MQRGFLKLGGKATHPLYIGRKAQQPLHLGRRPAHTSRRK